MGGVPKRQDPNPSMGMVTVSKELGTHLNAGKLNIFRAAHGCPPLVGKCELPASGDEPEPNYRMEAEAK